MNVVEKEIYRLAKPYLTVRDNDIHTRVALQCALKLLKYVEEADRRIVGPAIILHDVGWFMFPKDQFNQWRQDPDDNTINRIHEQEGVKIARGILKKVGYNERLIDEILSIVDRHDSGGEAKSVNEKVVRDSDALWRYTRTGFRVSQKTLKSTPADFIERLESKLDQWLFMPITKRLAREQLEERKQQIRTS